MDHIEVHFQKAGAIQVSKAEKQKVVRLDAKRGKMNRKGRRKASSRAAMHEYAQEVADTSAIDHLTPVCFPHNNPEKEKTRLLNILWDEIGIAYILEMLRHFPNGYFLDHALQTCRIDRIEFSPLGVVGEDEEGLLSEHVPGPSFPKLRVPVSQRGNLVIVEAANILADPFGLEVFSRMLDKHPCRYFHTTAFESLPISAIHRNKIEACNFSD